MMLTAEQEKFYEENQHLVYTAIKLYISNAGMYGINDYDDIVSIGNYGLCKAILSYDENKGQFSTHAIRVIKNTIIDELRKANKEALCLSTSDEFVEINADLAYNNIMDAHDEMLMEEALEMLNHCGYKGVALKGVEAIRLTMLGYSCSDIAKMYGVEPKTLTAWISRARQKLQKEPALLRLLGRA